MKARKGQYASNMVPMRQRSCEELAWASRLLMNGFDDYPRSLRLFMHEYNIEPWDAQHIAVRIKNYGYYDVELKNGTKVRLESDDAAV